MKLKIRDWLPHLTAWLHINEFRKQRPPRVRFWRHRPSRTASNLRWISTCLCFALKLCLKANPLPWTSCWVRSAVAPFTNFRQQTLSSTILATFSDASNSTGFMIFSGKRGFGRPLPFPKAIPVINVLLRLDLPRKMCPAKPSYFSNIVCRSRVSDLHLPRNQNYPQIQQCNNAFERSSNSSTTWYAEIFIKSRYKNLEK